MPTAGLQIIGMEDVRGRRPRVPQRARLGKTWQDRDWRQKLIDQSSSGVFRAYESDRPTNRRALPPRH